MLDLILFENDPELARVHLEAGVRSFMIDLEVLGKDLRQLGFDTEIRPGTLDALSAISSIDGATTWCRVNRFGEHTGEEIEAVIEAGADVILLPMAESMAEVDAYVGLVGQRCRAAVMIETQVLAEVSPDLRELPLNYAFFGLNDFAISRGGGSIFNALADGSVERVRKALPDIGFGVGGLTDIRRGSPIPSARLLEEMERLQCDFTFLRRSFRRDSKVTSPEEIVSGINQYWMECSKRTEAQRKTDHEQLVSLIRHSTGQGA